MKTLDHSSTIIVRKSEENHDDSEPLIPGLPDDIAEHCLLHLPYPYLAFVRSVSSSWNRAITNPEFLNKKTLSLPYIYVFAFHKSTAKLQWQAWDPRSGGWFILPPMPCPKSVCPAGFACASLPRQGALYVLGGMRSDTETSLQSLLTYRTSTNRWSVACAMQNPRSFFAAGSIGGKIFAAGGSGHRAADMVATECYDPEKDRWAPVAQMRSGLGRYDAAVLGNKMYVTEGWTWPFNFSPRGGVYDADRDIWEEMRVGMREGWTGMSVVLGERLFVINEHGDYRLKVYNSGSDSWKYVEGDGSPLKAFQKPIAVAGVEGRIYLVSCGLHMAVGTVVEVAEKGGEGLLVEWKVVRAPVAFHDFQPSNLQVLYA